MTATPSGACASGVSLGGVPRTLFVSFPVGAAVMPVAVNPGAGADAVGASAAVASETGVAVTLTVFGLESWFICAAAVAASVAAAASV